MTNYLKIDHEKRVLLQDKTFAKNASYAGTKEYYLLQEAQKNYPTYTPTIRKIQRNEKKETFAKVSYEFMENYIKKFANDKEKALEEFNNVRFIAEGVKNSYPKVKKWFLERYPEIKDFLKVEREQEKENKNPELTLNKTDIDMEEGA